MDISNTNSNYNANVINSDFLKNDSLQLKKTEQIDSITETRSQLSDEVSKNRSTSSLASSLQQSLSVFSAIQKTQGLVSQQEGVLSDMLSIVQNNTQGLELDSKQSDLQLLADKYNYLSQEVYKNSSEIIDEVSSEDSRTYFDGVPGALPLSSEEIAESVSTQVENVRKLRESLKEVSRSVFEESSRMITKEKKPEVASIDFKYETEQFQTQRFQELKTQFSYASVDKVDNSTLVFA